MLSFTVSFNTRAAQDPFARLIKLAASHNADELAVIAGDAFDAVPILDVTGLHVVLTPSAELLACIERLEAGRGG